jgi:hypothetical protein
MHRRVVAARGAPGITPQPELAELHAQRIEHQQPPHHRLTDAEQELDGLHRLERADDPRQHPKDPALRAGRHEPRRGGLREEAAVTRPAFRREDGELPVEAEDRAVDVRSTAQDTRVVDQIARREVVRAVDHQVVIREDFERVVGGETLRVRAEFDVGIDPGDPLACRIQLRTPDVRGVVQDLTLQVGRIDHVEIDHAERSDAGGGEVHGGRRAEPSRSDEQHAGRLQPALPVRPHLGEDQVAGVAQRLVAAQLHRGVGVTCNMLDHHRHPDYSRGGRP